MSTKQTKGATLYLLYLDQQCYNDQKESVGIYTSRDKAKEAAQILADKYNYSNRKIINWDGDEGEYKLFYIREIVLDSVDFNSSNYDNFNWS